MRTAKDVRKKARIGNFSAKTADFVIDKLDGKFRNPDLQARRHFSVPKLPSPLQAHQIDHAQARRRRHPDSITRSIRPCRQPLLSTLSSYLQHQKEEQRETTDRQSLFTDRGLPYPWGHAFGHCRYR